MAQLVQHRHNQPPQRPLPSPPPAAHQPTSLFPRRPDLNLLPDGRRISICQDGDGALVTDDIGLGCTRPIDHVYMHEDRDATLLASKLLDTTKLEESSITNTSSLLQPTPCEDREPNVLASKELFDTTTLKSNTDASSPLQPTPSGPGHSRHYLALQEPDMLSSKELLIDEAKLGISSIRDASSTRAEAIFAVKPTGWNHQFFIRPSGRVFHMYPKLDGPFQSLEEADKAILRRLHELRDPKMFTKDGLSTNEIAMRKALYWPDGKSKYSSKSNPDRDNIGLLVEALLDKYNEENKLSVDDAYHLENVVSFQQIYEGKGGWYYHLNCTKKTEGGVDNLFFAEVFIREGRLDEFELTCLCMVEPAVDNGPCYGCKKKTVGMKHPIDAGKYKGGHDPSWPRFLETPPTGPLDLPEDFDARMEAMVERIKFIYREPDDVVKSDAGRTADDVARMNKGGIRNTYGDRDVIKSDAGSTAAGLVGKRGKYVVPAKRPSVVPAMRPQYGDV